MSNRFFDAAKAAHDAGICVLPPMEDGSKRPMGPEWKRWQSERPRIQDLHNWYLRDGRTGVGHVCGAISNNLEMLELESWELYEAFKDRGVACGLGDLIERVEAGYSDRTPGGGVHLEYFCDEISGNTKLARRPKAPEEMKHPDDKVATLAESKGEGGYAVARPSNGRVHPSGGQYMAYRGGPATIVRITPAERRNLFDLARSFDEMPKAADEQERRTSGFDQDRPGDDFIAKTTWRDLLEGHGWTFVYSHGETAHWRRPGKTKGISATTNHGGHDYLYVFSTSTPFEIERAYNRFNAYAKLEHNDDYSAAARALKALGYGKQDPIINFPNATGAALNRTTPPWPTLDDAALYGLAGDVVRAILPHTEADPVALLGTTLALYGICVGRTPHYMAGEDRHGINEFFGLVGDTAKARKGSSRSGPERLFTAVDPTWASDRIRGGLSSGEGLLVVIADKATRLNKKGETETIVDGTDDKRLFVFEEELSQFLKVCRREGNILSEIFRRAWDGRNIGTMTKASPLHVTGPHFGGIGHIVRDELRRECSEIAIANGTANRIVWLCVKRSKADPHLEPMPDSLVGEIAAELRRAVDHGRKTGRMHWDTEARAAWSDVYPELSDGRPGLLGAVTARAEAHVVRLATMYALMDQATAIAPEHLGAALALWDYSAASAAYIFGDATGDPIADRVLTTLRANGPMAQTEISNLFDRNVGAGRLGQALELLVANSKVRSHREETAGRPRIIWEAVS